MVNLQKGNLAGRPRFVPIMGSRRIGEQDVGGRWVLECKEKKEKEKEKDSKEKKKQEGNRRRERGRGRSVRYYTLIFVCSDSPPATVKIGGIL